MLGFKSFSGLPGPIALNRPKKEQLVALRIQDIERLQWDRARLAPIYNTTPLEMKRLDGSQPPLANASNTDKRIRRDRQRLATLVQRQNPLVERILAVMGICDAS